MIQRNALRRKLDALTHLKVLLRHKYSYPQISANNVLLSRRNYYVLNLNNPLTIQVLTHDFTDSRTKLDNLLKIISENKRNDYHMEQRRQKGIRKLKEIKQVLDTITSDSFMLYLTKEQECVIIEELEEDSIRFTDSLNKDRKKRAFFKSLQNDEKIQKLYDQLGQALEIQVKQEQDFLVKSKRYATSIVEYTNELVKLGYSSLDVLIQSTCRTPEGNRIMYKLTWNTLYEPGFLEKYLNRRKEKN